MTLHEAINLIRPGVTPTSGTWADIGAGTGLFTEALMEILTEGKVIALDKSPHALYEIGNSTHGVDPAIPEECMREGNKNSTIGKKQIKVSFEIIEADFNQPLDLPMLDGVIMANSLHYALNHLTVLKNVVAHLKPKCTFLLIEYETDKPNPPWVPNPVPFKRFKELCELAGLMNPVVIGKHESIYSDGYIYVVSTTFT